MRVLISGVIPNIGFLINSKKTLIGFNDKINAISGEANCNFASSQIIGDKKNKHINKEFTRGGMSRNLELITATTNDKSVIKIVNKKTLGNAKKNVNSKECDDTKKIRGKIIIVCKKCKKFFITNLFVNPTKKTLLCFMCPEFS